MKQAIIDIGSNSMRLTLYDIEGKSFKILFKDKVMASLAGYVDHGYLTEEGAKRAEYGLEKFRGTVESLGIENVAVFATASLRNIKNSEAVKKRLSDFSGYNIEILSGEDEAAFGYAGAMEEFHLDDGVFADIGGASTEIVVFSNGIALNSHSYKVGSLELYKDCVRHILPGSGGKKRIRKRIDREIRKDAYAKYGPQKKLVCVGGTARATLKIAQRLLDLPEEVNKLHIDQLRAVRDYLTGDHDQVAEIILKIEPERIHTMIPGFMILSAIINDFGVKEISVGRYGVREGYLCRKILK
ncbi:MAG: hypothetical protein ACI4LM_07285 [Anaerovoracaceae bacterium]